MSFVDNPDKVSDQGSEVRGSEADFVTIRLGYISNPRFLLSVQLHYQLASKLSIQERQRHWCLLKDILQALFG